MNFTNQFFALREVNGQTLLTNQIEPSLSRPLDAIIEEQSTRLHFIEKVKLFLELKTNQGERRDVIYRLLTNRPYNLMISDNVLIQDEGDITACKTLLGESVRLKMGFPALDKIKLIINLWEKMIAADNYCRSWRQHLFSKVPIYLGGGDCYMTLTNAITEMKKSGIFARVYHNEVDLANDPNARIGHFVNPGTPEGALDWFDSSISIFRAPQMRVIEQVYNDETRRKEQAERMQQLAQAQGKRKKSKKRQ